MKGLFAPLQETSLAEFPETDKDVAHVQPAGHVERVFRGEEAVIHASVGFCSCSCNCNCNCSCNCDCACGCYCNCTDPQAYSSTLASPSSNNESNSSRGSHSSSEQSTGAGSKMSADSFSQMQSDSTTRGR